MPFSSEDYLEILRHIQRIVQNLEPDLFERLSEIAQIEATPRQRLLRYLSSLIGSYRQRSSESYAKVLNLLNRFVKPAEGRSIDGVSITLSVQERELYRVDEINLSDMPKREELIEALERVLHTIESEPPEERTRLR